MDIVWKDSQTGPLENLTKLSQFTGAYASATIDKAIEVRQLVKEKEENSTVGGTVGRGNIKY